MLTYYFYTKFKLVELAVLNKKVNNYSKYFENAIKK